ncbi:MAG: methylmalonyl-CoA mutase, partial [Planctomycetes bacterium]|nr:methylmalonyl-CoA mutase [Planctomycetota bacterium]
TNSMDETLALPTEDAVKLALRTQQVLAHETNVTQTADPLGGSWFVEKLTDEIEAEANRIFAQIEDLGGVLNAIDRGYFRRAIAESSLAESRQVESKEKIIVGVNEFREAEEPIEILQIGQEVEDLQKKRLSELRNTRDAKAHADALNRLEQDARDQANVMPALVLAAKAGATVGEMMQALQKVYGTYSGGPEW